MERLDIDQTVLWVINDLDIKPSIKSAIRKPIRFHDIWNIKDLCSKSEEELLQILDSDDKLLEVIKKYLRGYGLSLGMSEKDLSDYQDAEYYERHPEENTQIDTVPNEDAPFEALEEENLVVSVEDALDGSEDKELSAIMQRMREEYNPIVTPLDKNRKKPVPLLDRSLKQKIRTVFEHNTRSDVKKRLTDYSYMRLAADDMEWAWVNYFRMFYLSQPWYIRLLKSKTARIEMAKKDADEMREVYVQKLVSDISIGLTNKFCDSLDKDWNKNWESIMKELGIE